MAAVSKPALIKSAAGAVSRRNRQATASVNILR